MSGARVERRLAAIPAADVAGCSRLLGEDDAGTLARLAGLAHAMCDVSDEFVADLGHSCDRCIAEDLDFVPRLAPAGDDYEMVFTSPTAASSPIECLSPELGLPVTASGWQYF